MNKFVLRLMLLLMIFCYLFTNSSAQNKGHRNRGKIPSDFQVHLPVAVVNSKKQFVSGLTLNDFAVLENGRRQKIDLFTDEKNNPPAYIGLLMDTSPSTQAKLKYIKNVSKNLVYTITRQRKNKSALMTFDHVINLRQDFTDKIDLLDRSIDKVKESGTENSLYDAIYQFCDEKLRGASGRRAIIVISDGKDTFSRANLDDAINIAQQTETVVYIVTTNNEVLKTNQIKLEEAKNSGNDFLFRLTAETGG